MPRLFCFQETRIRRAEALMILAAEYKKKSVADKDGLSTFVTQMGAQTGTEKFVEKNDIKMKLLEVLREKLARVEEAK
eukprot:gene35590-46155_t